MPPTVEQDNSRIERLEQSHGLVHEAGRLHRVLGPLQPLPRELTDPELDLNQAETLFRSIRGTPVTLQELLRGQTIRHRMDAIQHLNAIAGAQNEGARRGHTAEHLVANQGVALNLHVAAALHRVDDSLHNTLRMWHQVVPNLPPADRQLMAQQHEQSRVYVNRLNTVGGNLLHFSNFRMLNIAYDNLGSCIGAEGKPRTLPTAAAWQRLQDRGAEAWARLMRENEHLRRIADDAGINGGNGTPVEKLAALEAAIPAERQRLRQRMDAEAALIPQQGAAGTIGQLNQLAMQAGTDNPRKLAYLRGVEAYVSQQIQHVDGLLAARGDAALSTRQREIVQAQKEHLTQRRTRVQELIAQPAAALSTFIVIDFHEQFLKQQVVNLLAGHAERDGANGQAVAPGSWPQLLEIETLQMRATQILRLQEAIARDERIPAAEKQVRQQRYSEERQRIMGQLTRLTDDLGRFQLDMLRMVSIQEQFGELLPMRDVRQARPPSVTQRVRDQYERYHNDQRIHHANRVLSMLDTAREQFNPNALDQLADAAKMGFVEAVNAASEWFGGAIEWVINGALLPNALRQRMRVTLNLNLQDAMRTEIDERLLRPGDGQQVPRVGGQPLTRERIRQIQREGEPDNAPAEKKALLTELNGHRRRMLAQMMQSVRVPMREFHNAEELPRLRDTMEAIKDMPSAAEFVEGRDVGNDGLREYMENGRVTRAKVQLFKQRMAGMQAAQKRDIGATLYRKLLEQGNADWGTLGTQGERGQPGTEGTGFVGKYQRMLRAFDAITGDRLNLIAHCSDIADNWQAVGAALIAAGGGIATVPIWIGTAVAVAYSGVKYGGRALRAGGAWLRGVARGGPATWAGRTLGVAALVGQGLRTYEHVRDINERNRNTERQREAFIDALYLSGFQGYYEEDGQHKWTDNNTAAPDRYTKPTIFYYNENPARPWTDGTEPPSAETTPHIRPAQINEMAVGVGHRALRHGSDAVELALLANALRLGVRGNIITGAIILGIEGVNCFAEHNRILGFLRSVKPSVLAHIDPMQTFRLSHYELLELFSRDAFTSAAERQSVREKLFFSLFYQEISKFPQMMQAVFPQGGHLSELDTYFESSEGGFKDVVLPLIYLRLNKRFGNDNISWADLKTGRINNFHLIQLLQKPLGRYEIQAAIREAAILAAEDRKERSYRDIDALLTRLEARPEGQRGPRHAEMVDLVRGMRENARQQTVFGQRLGEADLRNVPAGKTRTQLLIEHMYARLDRDGKASHSVAATDVPGLPRALDLNDPDTIYNLVTDPVLRNELRQASLYRTQFELAFRWTGRRNAFEDEGPDVPQYDGYQVPLITTPGEENAPERDRMRPQVRAIITALGERAETYEGAALTDADRNAHTRIRSHNDAQHLLTVYGMRLLATYRVQAERAAQQANRRLPRCHFVCHVPTGERMAADWPRGPGMPPVRLFHTTENNGTSTFVLPDWASLAQRQPELTRERVLAVFGEQVTVDGKELHGTTIVFGDANGQNIHVLQSTRYGDNPASDGWHMVSTADQFVTRQPHGRTMIDLATKPEHQPPRERGANAVQPRPQQVAAPRLAALPADINGAQPRVGPAGPAQQPALPEGLNVQRQGEVTRVNGVAVRALDERIPRTRQRPNQEPEQYTISRDEHVTEFDAMMRNYYTQLEGSAGVARVNTLLGVRAATGLHVDDRYFISLYRPTEGGSGLILRSNPYQRRHMAGRPPTSTPYLSPGFGTNIVPHRTQAALNRTTDATLLRSADDFHQHFTFYNWDAAQDRAFLSRPPFRLPNGAPHNLGPLIPWRLSNIRDINERTLHGATITPAQRAMFIAALTTPYNLEHGEDMNDHSLKDVINLCDTGTRADGENRRLCSQDVFYYLAPMYRQLGRPRTSEARQQQQAFLRQVVEVLASREVNGTLRGAPPTAEAFRAGGFTPPENNTTQIALLRISTWFRERHGTPPAPLEPNDR